MVISLARDTNKCKQPATQCGGPMPPRLLVVRGARKRHSKVSGAPQNPLSRSPARSTLQPLRNPRAPKKRRGKTSVVPIDRRCSQNSATRQLSHPVFFSRSLLCHPFPSPARFTRPLNLDPLAPPFSSHHTLRTSLSFRRAQLGIISTLSRQAKKNLGAEHELRQNVSYNLPRQTRKLGQDGPC